MSDMFFSLGGQRNAKKKAPWKQKSSHNKGGKQLNH